MKKILLALLAVIVLFAIYVATRPNTYRIERASTIAASPATLYPMIADFHRWPEWSPFEKLDPQMKRELSGAQSGVGAVYAWAGNKDAGEGRMTITEATPDQDVTIRLEFLKPIPGSSTARFALGPAEGGTQVRWIMEGDHNFVSKAMCVFVSMDKMMGGDFEKGLAQMKTAAEASEAAAPADTTAAMPKS